MASRYGFMTEEEVKQATEQEKGALNERRKKERERLECVWKGIGKVASCPKQALSGRKMLQID